MKVQRMLLASMMAAGTLVSSVAFAQLHSDQVGGPYHDNGQRGIAPTYRSDNHPPQRMEAHHAWHRGDRLPAEYRNRQYVVNDWHSHHLSTPPRGYQWVGVGGDYLLVRIADGVVLQLGP